MTHFYAIKIILISHYVGRKVCYHSLIFELFIAGRVFLLWVFNLVMPSKNRSPLFWSVASKMRLWQKNIMNVSILEGNTAFPPKNGKGFCLCLRRTIMSISSVFCKYNSKTILNIFLIAYSQFSDTETFKFIYIMMAN